MKYLKTHSDNNRLSSKGRKTDGLNLCCLALGGFWLAALGAFGIVLGLLLGLL